MKRALERQREGAARVIAVTLEPCDWKSAPFGKSLVVPTDGGRTLRKKIFVVVERASRDEGSTTGSLHPLTSLLASTSAAAARSSSTAPAPAAQSTTAFRPRSSDLGITKEFTDFDKGEFLHKAFGFMSRCFQDSLGELAARNPGSRTRFQPADSQRFSATAYRGGETIAECSVSVSGYSDRSTMLIFSYSANAMPGSSNEMLSVDFDTQAIFFKPLGMQSHHRTKHRQLSEQGASDYYWNLFIEALQR